VQRTAYKDRLLLLLLQKENKPGIPPNRAATHPQQLLQQHTQSSNLQEVQVFCKRISAQVGL
jgi:hypothetical protein